ncbi:rhomboid family intramembrane serine protease [Thalassoglobus polymorphus]|uniref:Rhomboid protease GlpG n=1 Tax=Thalassoglobus polymorphus TaxID=2527994 RepID=A0A517QUB7_9PLAN|nr:rhomboid family intramembrane serine protease [Thalassoglobus polymorphus]QDT35242.1 Rhomboid protease GlpG [Thalassoglobus polymorphus]
MRKIGTLESSKDAERFHRFLRSEGIDNQIDQVPPSWEIWVLSDADLDRAKAELESFKNFPTDKRFNVKHVPPPKAQPEAKAPRRRARSHDIPVTRFLLISCIVLTIYTGMGTRHPELMGKLKFSNVAKVGETFQVPPEILHGEIWRIFTPAFIHGSFFHLAFNLYFLWILGNTIERTKGSILFALLCFVTAVGGHFTQYFIVGPNFIGISGVVYGLLGYLWMKQMVSPEEGYAIPDILIVQMLIWLMLGISGVLESWGIPVANGAHFGGLLAGMLLGAFPGRKRVVT